MSEYLGVLLLSVAVPFILSFYPRLKFWRSIRALGLSIGAVVIIFGAWDVFAAFRQHWWFNPQGVWPARILGLPIEEWLFFVFIPFCCIFTWEALKFIRNKFLK